MSFRYASAAVFIGAAGVCVGLSPIELSVDQPASQPATQPSNQPSRNPANQPANPPATQPSGQPNAQPGQPAPRPEAQPADAQTPSRSAQGARNSRMFAFQNEADEARFNEGARRLLRLEQRAERTNQELLRRLGEVRQMNADRQPAATMDLLQQILKSQTELHQYLVMSRSMWTGDIDLPADAADPTRSGSPDNPNAPASPSRTPTPTPAPAPAPTPTTPPR